MIAAGTKPVNFISSDSTKLPYIEIKTLRDLFDLNVTVFGVSPEVEKNKFKYFLETGKVKKS